MVTGIIDQQSSIEIEDLWQPGAAPTQVTECAHIFAESTNDGMEDEWRVPTLFRLPGPPFVYSTLRSRTLRTSG